MTRRRSRLGQVLSAGAAVLLLVILLGPFFQVVYGALFPQAAGFSLEPVYQVFLATPEYLLVFWRTLALCALIVAGQTVLSVLAGLGFAKDHFPGKGLCFFLLLVVMVLPLQVTLVPNFRILGTLGLLDTQWALVLPALFAPLGTFLMTQSFRAVPDEILEAAQLDGANMVQALGKILVPMSKNGLACVVVLTFLETWTMVEQPMAYLKDTSQHPLSVALATTQARDVGVQLACCLLALLPPLLLFLGLRKELLEGIALQENWTGERAHRGFCRALAVALVVLVECTVLSGFISREMAIQVEGVPPQTDRAAGTNSLPLDAFHQEEDGTFLYLLEESAGLTQGMELRRVPADILGMEGDRAFTTGLEDRGTYALYGSRPLEDEARAVELAAQDPAPDTYLLWAPAGVELSLNAASAPVDGGTVYLLPQEEAAQPFLAQRELASLVPAEVRDQCRLFSFREIQQFAQALPWVGLAVILMVAPLVCCAGLCLSLGRKKTVPLLLWAGLMAASLAGLGAVLAKLELPPSLLPEEILLDLSSWASTFSLLGKSLAAFPEAAGALEGALGQGLSVFGSIAAWGVAVLAAVLAGRLFLQRRRGLPRKGRHFERW